MPLPHEILSVAFAQQQSGQVASSERTLRAGLRQWPNDVGINFALGSLLHANHRAREALIFAQRASELDAKQRSADPRPLVLLAKCLLLCNKFDQCDSAAKRALALAPDDVDALNTLGNSLLARQRSDEALPLLERALAIEPDSVTCAVTHAAVLADLAQAEKAHAVMCAAAEREPNNTPILVGCASGSLYCASVTAEEKLRLAQRAGALVRASAVAAGPVRHDVVDFSPSRTLRLGVVSNDFRQHSCAYFLSGLLHHVTPSRHGVSLVCFSLTDSPDRVTEQLRNGVVSNGGIWHDVHNLHSVQLAERVVRERIDVVLDLGGWSAGSGIEAMALKPAPLIGTYLGYPGTTGLQEIDFRIVDEVTDPSPGESVVSGEEVDPQAWHTERLVRLKRCFVCYDRTKAPDTPRSPRAADSTSPVTFGSFNTPAKISSKCLDLWAAVLRRVEGSRILLKGVGLEGTSSPRYLRDQFVMRGISAERIVCRGRTGSVAEHLSHYEQVDIALDPFPYNGTTTTCEALAMGVPVVSLAGIEHVSRVGASLLTHSGMSEFIAHSSDDFVEIAARLASDGTSLQRAHATVRERFLQSQVCDPTGFADAIAAAIRREWVDMAQRRTGAL
jgi:predicted O-linked N-acetylglucosamine transferase (SPINDLY family)